jgi:hypothetical protein
LTGGANRPVIPAVDTSFPLRRTAKHGAIVLLIPFLVGLALRLAGMEPAMAIFAVAVAVVPGAIVALTQPVPIWAGIAGFLLLIIAPFAAVILVEERGLGTLPRVAAEEAWSHRLAAGFRLGELAPRPDLAQIAVVSGGQWTPHPTTSRRRAMPWTHRYRVTPVVPPGWTPDQPVHLLDVVDATAPAMPAAPAGFMLLLPDPEHDIAMRRALRQAGLVAAPVLVAGRLAEEPVAAQLGAWLPGLAVLAGTLAAWLALVAIASHRRRDKGR